MLLLPAVLTTAAIIIYPILTAIDISFQQVRIAQLGRVRTDWTLANYERLFTSAEFWQAAWVTVMLVVIVTSCCFLLGMGTALLVNQRFWGRTLARMLIALPWAVPSVVGATIWWWLFDSSFGLVNWMLVRLSLISSPIAWFSYSWSAILVVCVTMIWLAYPFISVMLLAGLQGIPEELYQAARIDGAGDWQCFRYITLPALRPVLAIALVLVALWVFRDFPVIWILTGGGPVRSTQTLAIMTYREGFNFFNMGYAAAIGIITLIICIATSIVMIKRIGRQFY